MSGMSYSEVLAAQVAQAEATGDWSAVHAVKHDEWLVASGKYKGLTISVWEVTAGGTVKGDVEVAENGYQRRREVMIPRTSLGARTRDGRAWLAEQRREELRRRYLEQVRMAGLRAQERRKNLAAVRTFWGKVRTFARRGPEQRAMLAHLLRATGDLLVTDLRERDWHNPLYANRATLYRLAYQLDGDGAVVYRRTSAGQRVRPQTPWVRKGVAPEKAEE